jgi:AraC-like DNA-binding protein
MRYGETEPPEDLAPFVGSLWTFHSDAADPNPVAHVIPPDGAVSISCAQFPGAAAHMAIARPARLALRVAFPRGACFAGARLRAGVAGSLLRRDIGALAEGMTPLAAPAASAAAAADTDSMIAAVLAVIRALARDGDPPDEAIIGGAARICAAGGDIDIAEIVGASGLGERQFRRRFRRQTGLAPKEFARLRRVRSACTALVRLHGKTLSEASLVAGFADQAHMTREFREVFGQSTSLIVAYLRQIEHGRLIDG